MKNVKRPDILLNGEVSRVNCFLRKGSFIYTAVPSYSSHIVSIPIEECVICIDYVSVLSNLQSKLFAVTDDSGLGYFPFQHQQTKIFIVFPLGKQLYPHTRTILLNVFQKCLLSPKSMFLLLGWSKLNKCQVRLYKLFVLYKTA